MTLFLRTTALAGLLLGLAACDAPSAVDETASQTQGPPTVAEARAFVDLVEATYEEKSQNWSRIFWVQANFITDDTNALAAAASRESNDLGVMFANQAKRFNGLELPADLQRKIDFIKQGLTVPAPSDATKSAELAEIKSKLQALYSTGKGTYKGEPTSGNDLEALMGTERDPALLKEMWASWHTIAEPMKPLYARMVEIANEGSAELGFADTGDLWRSKYDMSADDFAAMIEQAWSDTKPFYDALHCHVRARLSDHYGADIVPQTGPIPAHLLGNMWAQTWSNVYDLVAPENADPGIDLTAALNAKGYTPVKFAQTADSFFQSLGFDPLPETFYERSLFEKPADREVVCHASAWDLDDRDDIRVKMCTKVNADDFETMHHEIGHNIYQRAYKDQPLLYRDDPNDGFHEAIGDLIALSVTPDYLQQIGVIDDVPSADKDIGLLLETALDKIAFLPFALTVDKWRWAVFSGEVKPESYNDYWVQLKRDYQGITPPVDRGEAAFDPGAKYHIPGNTPYMRYFQSFIFQFQFHRAACEMAGWEGPLHRCSIYNNKEVGERFAAMLELGASKPWQEALQAFTGETTLDASAIIAYFAPLKAWLDEQNEGRQCGW